MKKKKLNKKDLELLTLLDSNARGTLKELSEKLKISKQAIKAKINKYSEQGYVKRYVTVIDSVKLGRKFADLYLNIQGMSKKNEREVINEVKKTKGVSGCISFLGDYTHAIGIKYNNPTDLSDKIGKIQEIIGENIIEKHLYIIKDMTNMNIDLTAKNTAGGFISKNNKIEKISEFEKQIISKIVRNSRFTYTDLAYDLRKSPKTIKEKIKDMEEKGIIKGYKTSLDYGLMGLSLNICLIEVTSKKEAHLILNYLQKNLMIPFYSEDVEGNLIVNLLSNDYHEIKKSLLEIKKRYLSIKKLKLLISESWEMTPFKL